MSDIAEQAKFLAETADEIAKLEQKIQTSRGIVAHQLTRIENYKVDLARLEEAAKPIIAQVAARFEKA